MDSTWYALARDIWQGAKWIWSAVVITILVGVAINLFAGTEGTALASLVLKFTAWLHESGFYQGLILSLIGLFMVISLASGITTFVFRKRYETPNSPPPEVQAILDYIKKDIEATKQRDEVRQARDREAFTQYLRAIEEMCENIRPGGIAQLSRALIFADVPLNETFVALQVVPDKPIYDAPGEQQRQLEALRQRTDLSIEERDAYLQRLRIIWQSQLSRDVQVDQAQQPLLLDEVLSRLTTTNPIAVLIGTPGSGKSTFLRWLALHMARASLTPGAYSLPKGLGREQVPILIQMKEYAERLDKDYLSLKQFLILQWSGIHPNLAMKLLDELAQGRCLVLFDGVDQVATVNLRRRVIDAIHEFIADCSTEDANNFNRFIVTSRIADSEPGAFAKYTHYTLLDLDQHRIEHTLTNWCLAIARFRTMAIKGMQPLTGQEEAKARTAGAKQQEQLTLLLRSNPDIMRLAVSPMTLAIMVLLQASGRNLLEHRLELYQMITRTLLDYWNRESGRKMFTSEEIPLAEQLLSNLAYSLYERGTMLTAYDVMMTTRMTLATFYQRQAGEIRESDITQFIETLRWSSGLFVEGGEDLFYFANRTIQDYYVVLFLLHMPQEQLKQFAFQNYQSDTWRDFLLQALAYKSSLVLLSARSRQLDETATYKGSSSQIPILSKPEDRAREIQALQREHKLTKAQVEELLAATIDTRSLPGNIQPELGVNTVQELAWKLLKQPFVLEDEAMDAVLRALDSNKAPVVEGAVMLLQHSKPLPRDAQQSTTQKIWQLLIDDHEQHRFSKLGYIELLRLYNTLFKTSQAITDHS